MFGSMALCLAQSQLPDCEQNVTRYPMLFHCAFPTVVDSIYP